ncbi:MAG: ABC transporter substrate-binding protein, partial [Acidimicrobiia bacterium]
MRIVSLLPSATDIVCSLGLRDNLVGRTHECDWPLGPLGIENVPVMTSNLLDLNSKGGKSSREIDDAVGSHKHSGSSIYALDVDALRAADPDLILTQELCDVCAVSYDDVARAARLIEGSPTVVSLEPTSIDEIFENVTTVGRLTGTREAASDVVSNGRLRLQRLHDALRPKPPIRVFCVEWLDPIYASGHWVPEQVEIAGGIEVLGIAGRPSRTVSWEQVV